VPVVAALLLLFEFRKHITKRLVLNLCVFMLAFLATLTPWLYRNYRTFGVVALTPQSEVALYAVYAPSVLAVANHTGFQEEYDKLQAQGVTGPNQTGFGQSDGYTQKAISIFKSHPKAFVLESLNTEISFFTHDGVLDVMRHIGADTGVRLGAPALFLLLKNPLAFAGVVVRLSVTPLGLVLVGRIFWVLTTLLFFFGAYQYWKRYGLTFPVTLSVLVVLYFAATTVLVGLTVNSRYRLPVSALIAMFAAYGLWSLYRWYKSRRAPRS
jgi:hypothetical protein